MRKKTKRDKAEKLEYEMSSGDVFADFGFKNPKESNAKYDLAMLIGAIIKQRRLTQVKAGQLMEMDQPKVSKITRGILSEFTIERLMNCLLALGCDLEIRPSRSITPSIHVAKYDHLLTRKRLNA